MVQTVKLKPVSYTHLDVYKRQRMYSSTDLQSSSILRNFEEYILFIHAISGCDTTSGFFGKGKQQYVQMFNWKKDLDSVVHVFNHAESTLQWRSLAGATGAAAADEMCIRDRYVAV